MPQFAGRSQTTPLSVPFLMPRENWGEKVRARKDDLLYQKALADEREKELINFQQQRAQFQQSIENTRNLPFLEEDRNRISMLIDGFEKTINDKIKKKYNGNHQNYFAQEGDIDKKQFVSMITKSDAFNAATNNKQAMANYLKDRESGRMVKMAGGRTFSDQYADFRSGRTNVLTYNGSYKPSDDFYKGIEEKYGTDKFTRERATPEKIVGEIMKRGGLSQEEAIDQFTQQRLDQVPIYYKHDDQYDKAKYQADLAKTLRQAQGKDASGSGPKGSDIVDFAELVFRGNVTPTTIKVNGVPYQGTTSVPGAMNARSRDLLMGSIGGVPTEKNASTYTIDKSIPLITENGTALTSGVSVFRPNRTVSVNVNIDPRTGKPKMKNGVAMEPYYEDYIVGSALVNEQEAESIGVEGTGWTGLRAYSDDIGGSKVNKIGSGSFWEMGLVSG